MKKAFIDGANEGRTLSLLGDHLIFSDLDPEFVAGVVWGFTDRAFNYDLSDAFYLSLGQNAFQVGLSRDQACRFMGLYDSADESFAKGFALAESASQLTV